MAVSLRSRCERVAAGRVIRIRSWSDSLAFLEIFLPKPQFQQPQVKAHAVGCGRKNARSTSQTCSKVQASARLDALKLSDANND